MTWIKDTYITLFGDKEINANCVATGKFINQGGIQGRSESTGLGIYYGMKELFDTKSFLSKVGLPSGIQGKRVIVQGFGNVGYWTAKHFQSQGGAKIIGIVEKNSAIYNENGLDPD